MWTDSDIVIEWVWKKRRGESLLKHGNRKESIYISDDLWVCKISFLGGDLFSFSVRLRGVWRVYLVYSLFKIASGLPSPPLHMLSRHRSEEICPLKEGSFKMNKMDPSAARGQDCCLGCLHCNSSSILFPFHLGTVFHKPSPKAWERWPLLECQPLHCGAVSCIVWPI